MPRRHKNPEPLTDFKRRKADEREEAVRLREELITTLTRYWERLGEAEVLRRLRIDYLDEGERVQRFKRVNGEIRFLGNQPLTEDHPEIKAIDARLA
ncbi:MAG: hypothetical protein AAGA69_12615, partial [Pseudomonadota bacterium]